ncbi:PKD domain-containing protein, partial [Kaarinaea lacus]
SANAGVDQTVNEQTTVTLAGSGSDGDGSIASYSWSQTGGTAVTLSNDNTDTATFTAPTLITQVQLMFQLTVTDNEGASSTDQLIVTVNPVNLNPSADAGTGQTVNEQTEVTLSGVANDTDGAIVSYVWSQTGGTAVTLNNANTDTATFTAPILTVQTQFTFRLTVTDNEGGTFSDNTVITVNPVNATPTANAGDDQIVNERTAISLSGSGSDSDGSIASVQWLQTAGAAVTLSGADTDTATFMAPDVSTRTELTFEFTVTDNEGGITSDTVIITVNPVIVSTTAEATDSGGGGAFNAVMVFIMLCLGMVRRFISSTKIHSV